MITQAHIVASMEANGWLSITGSLRVSLDVYLTKGTRLVAIRPSGQLVLVAA